MISKAINYFLSKSFLNYRFELLEKFTHEDLQSKIIQYQTETDRLLKTTSELVERMDAQNSELVALRNRIQNNPYIPMPPLLTMSESTSFMQHSTCSVSDLLNPKYQEIVSRLKHPFVWHRKLWEFVFVVHHLTESGIVKQGSRGLVFGVGSERLPALFASMGAEIVATDAPIEIGNEWQSTNQYSNSLELLRYPEIIDNDLFDSKVTFRHCDMNNIAPDLVGFDFNWSACCFEHLGGLEAGMQFVINAVEQTLRPGGVAVHTTEFNLSSNTETLEDPGCSIYRLRDIEELVTRLRERGHTVKPFTVAPDSHYYDFHVDVPPYSNNLHLKLLLQNYVTTSVGIVVRKAE